MAHIFSSIRPFKIRIDILPAISSSWTRQNMLWFILVLLLISSLEIKSHFICLSGTLHRKHLFIIHVVRNMMIWWHQTQLIVKSTNSIMRFKICILLHNLIAFYHFKLFVSNLFVSVSLLCLKNDILNVVLNRLILLRNLITITSSIECVIAIFIHKDIAINVFLLIFEILVLILH